MTGKFALDFRHSYIGWTPMLVLLGTAGLMLVLLGTAGLAQENTTEGDWIQLFNGKNLDGWRVKIRQHDLDDNFGNTFRVEDGLLKVGYEQYDKFDEQFGHLFYKDNVFQLRYARRISVCRRASAGRPGLGDSQ